MIFLLFMIFRLQRGSFVSITPGRIIETGRVIFAQATCKSVHSYPQLFGFSARPVLPCGLENSRTRWQQGVSRLVQCMRSQCAAQCTLHPPAASVVYLLARLTLSLSLFFPSAVSRLVTHFRHDDRTPDGTAFCRARVCTPTRHQFSSLVRDSSSRSLAHSRCQCMQILSANLLSACASVLGRL